MKLIPITDLEEQLNKVPCALALGNFDGVHLGHRALVKNAVASPYPAAVFTFSDKADGVITPLARKSQLLEALGVSFLFVAPFSLFKSLTPEDFVRYLKTNLSAKHLVCGYNFRFGKGALGTPETLLVLAQNAGLTADVEREVRYQNESVSSTAIRTLLDAGDVTKASQLLGAPYILSGKVVRGFGIGKTMSFATLNLALTQTPLLPHGVYITEAMIDGKCYPAITNIGTNPTFSRENVSCETHLLNTSGDFYEKQVEIRFLSHLRREMSFPSPEALKQQVLADIKTAESYHKTKSDTV